MTRARPAIARGTLDVTAKKGAVLGEDDETHRPNDQGAEGTALETTTSGKKGFYSPSHIDTVLEGLHTHTKSTRGEREYLRAAK